MVTSVLLIRHGQTEWNRIERFRGHFDIALNQDGIIQAQNTASRIFRQWHPSAVFSSPLGRAIQTAEIIAKVCSLTIQQNPGFVDIDYGKWQGLTPNEVRETWPDLADVWYHHPERSRIPGGESLSQVQERAMAATLQLAKQHENQTIALVSHTVVNRLIIMGCLDIPLDRFWYLQQDPCGISLLKIQGQEKTVIFVNDTCHIESNKLPC